MRKRKLLWILLPLPLLLLVTYLALPYVARSLIEDWLASQGFEKPSIKLTHPGWEQLKIPELSLTQRSGERSIHLQSADISVLFDPLALLLRQQIDEIRIPELTINIRAERSLERRLESTARDSLNLNDYPPSLIFQYAPARRLVVGQIHIDYQAPDQPEIRAAGNLDLTPAQLLSWARVEVIDDEESPPLSPVYLDLRFNTEQQISLDLVSDNRRLLSSRGALTTGVESWTLTLDSDLRLEPLLDLLRPTLPELPLTLTEINGHLQGNLTSRWPARLPLDSQTLLKQTRTTLAFQLESEGLGLTGPDNMALESAKLKTAGHLSLEDAALNLQLEPDSLMRGENLSLANLQVGTLQAALLKPVELQQSLEANRPPPQLSPIELRVTPERIALPELDSLQTSPWDLSLGYNPASGQVSYHLRSERIAASIADRPLPPFAAALTGGSASDGQRGNLTLQSTEPPIQLDAYWLLAPDDFRADWHSTSIDLPAVQTELRRWIDGWPVDLAFTHGHLNAKGYLQGPSPSDTSLFADLALRQVAFAWDTYLETDNLNADLTVRRSRSGNLTSEGEIRNELLRTGVDLHNTVLTYRYSQPNQGLPKLELDPIEQPLFGGTIRLPAFTFNPLDPDFTVTASLDGIELSELLELYQQPGLAGDTPLSGSLPIRVKGSDISVSGGQIRSASPGWLRYQPSSSLSTTAQNNAALQLALSALEDLQIKALDLDVNYAPDGSLELKSRLQGHNPDWQQGRPIDLSLNVEENLLALFKSLQLSEKIGESLRKNLENQNSSPQ